MNEALKQVSNLVDRFQNNLDAYRSPAYNETQLRIEFIDPFFEALGWDVANKAGYAEQYKDVIHEDAIKVSGATKAPDYCFRIGGVRKFFLETKKPSIDIKDQVGPAYQLRRYAWSAKLPLSILTNFAELAIYDCRIRPKPGDKTSTGRVRFYPYTEYIKSIEEIYNLFSKESVLKGSFDKFAETDRLKRGTTEVDSEFLREIEYWREILAKDIARRNPKLSVRDLNYAVQLTIDRIIFLRMCEDRGIESYGQIQSLLNGTNTYHRLREYFYHADGKYNSGLFDFKTDRLTPELTIDDHPLKDIFKNLYYPDSPYEFSVLGTDILGHVYEQFLGKVIRLTGGHQAKVEEKPEVRKAGGVYYTPTYIVDYIVKNTVGKLCEGKTPRQIGPLRILDPACGSGSFLLGAYQYLLDFHRDWYQKNGIQKHTKEIYQGRGGQWYLTIQEKKRILLNNIYGVDIDPQAVEVTKLSLLLKVLEGENQDSLEKQMKLFKERALPDLGDNIKCGNSLIGSDYYQGKQISLLGGQEYYNINAFDWDDQFPSIMGVGGFDAVIGNPPYVFGRDWKVLNIGDEVKKYLGDRYKSSPYQLDMFSIFMEKASELCKVKGYIGQIVPNVWLTNTYSSSTRSFILGHASGLCILVPPPNVFQNLTVDTVIYTFRKTIQPGKSLQIRRMINGNILETATQNADQYLDGQHPISTSLDTLSSNLILKLKRIHPELQRVANITRGVHPYRIGGYGKSAFGPGAQTSRDVKERPYHSKNKKEGYRPFIYGRNLHRFSPPTATEYVKYGPWLAEPRQPEFFQGDRVYSRKILGDRLVVTVETTDSVADQQVYITVPEANTVKASYLAGILGSRLIAFFIRRFYDEINDAFPQIKVTQLKALPIRSIDLSDPLAKAQHDQMTELVDKIISLQKKLSIIKAPNEKIILGRQIQATDKQIDAFVYKLYGLTEKEIRTVEEGSL